MECAEKRLNALKYAQDLEEFNARVKGYTEIDLDEMLKKAARIAAYLDGFYINSNEIAIAVSETDTKDTTQDLKDTV